MISDIVTENLAADFDGSLSGLGVDIHNSSFSMSEALNALPNLSISSSQIFKQDLQHHHQGLATVVKASGSPLKQEVLDISTTRSPASKDGGNKSYGALDLSNDEAYLPGGNSGGEGGEDNTGPVTFAGSVSRESTPSGTLTFNQHFSKNPHHHQLDQQQQQQQLKSYAMNLSSSNPNLSTTTLESQQQQGAGSSHKVLLQQSPVGDGAAAGGGQRPRVDSMKVEKRSYETIATGDMDNLGGSSSQLINNFQYILAASTSIATKLNEPSITYLNQGQAYELRLKKLGDLSPFRKRLLKCVMRICFHERRLQYMEAEQIAEWSVKHPGERIIDVDLPLSYGVVEPYRDPNSLNSLTFKWDPTRDTGIFIKVNCISTEFTPKKHGGEKGVPFRLQVETCDNDQRVHAAGCILQVFKLKGADRKHKQDRDKINKRPLTEQEKYSPSYDCTVLSDLPIEHIYVPVVQNSRSATPTTINGHGAQQGGNVGMGVSGDVGVNAGGGVVVDSPNRVGEFVSPAHAHPPITRNDSEKEVFIRSGGRMPGDQYGHLEGTPLLATASVAEVSAWLVANRYKASLDLFRNYNGRDMLRLVREEIIHLVGPTDGIRLYNDLHMVAVYPRTTFYVGAKDGDNEYSAIYLEELTVRELLQRLAEAFGFAPVDILKGAYVVGPHGILVRVTNSVLQNTKPETVFQFSLRTAAHQDDLQQDTNVVSCEVILEEITNVQSVSNDSISPEGHSHNAHSC